MKIEVGKFYMCANGEIVEITEKLNAKLFRTNNRYSYYHNGRYQENIETTRDLIAEIPKELHQHLIKEVMNYWQDEDFRDAVNNVYGGEKWLK